MRGDHWAARPGLESPGKACHLESQLVAPGHGHTTPGLRGPPAVWVNNAPPPPPDSAGTVIDHALWILMHPWLPRRPLGGPLTSPSRTQPGQRRGEESEPVPRARGGGVRGHLRGSRGWAWCPVDEEPQGNRWRPGHCCPVCRLLLLAGFCPGLLLLLSLLWGEAFLPLPSPTPGRPSSQPEMRLPDSPQSTSLRPQDPFRGHPAPSSLGPSLLEALVLQPEHLPLYSPAWGVWSTP